MPTISKPILLGFLAGVLSHLIFQGAFGSILYSAELFPSLPWSLKPVPPLGVPKSLSLGFWAGLWGVIYLWLEPRATARFGWWFGGLVFGLAPLAVQWFLVLPLKGMGAGGGFHPAMVPIDIGFHAAFGMGLAITCRVSSILSRRKPHSRLSDKSSSSPEQKRTFT